MVFVLWSRVSYGYRTLMGLLKDWTVWPEIIVSFNLLCFVFSSLLIVFQTRSHSASHCWRHTSRPLLCSDCINQRHWPWFPLLPHWNDIHEKKYPGTKINLFTNDSLLSIVYNSNSLISKRPWQPSAIGV